MPEAEPEIIEMPAEDAAAGVLQQPQPQMPPANESGFPMLPMFGQEASELFNQACATGTSLFTMGTALREGVMMSGVGVIGEASSAQVGTQVATPMGVLKAEVVSAGVLQTALEGFAPLPFLNFNTQLAFVPAGLAGGVLQSVMLTPVGMVMACANTGGQLSAEFLTGAAIPNFANSMAPEEAKGGAPTDKDAPTSSSQLLLGAHVWGLPGLLGGVKTAIEWQHAHVTADEELLGASSVTLGARAYIHTSQPWRRKPRDAPAHSVLARVRARACTTRC